MAEFKISVVIAAYHGEKYIGELLKSLFAQTRTPDEILIGDDSDDDATFQAVEAVRNQYAGEFRYIRNPKRLGPCANFENLYRQAVGNLVFFCDQDDVWLPEKIEKMSRYMEEHPSCDLLFCDSLCVDSKLSSLQFTLMSRYSVNPADLDRINRGCAFPVIVMKDIPFAGHNMAVRKPLDYNVFPFENEFNIYHDQHLGCLMSYMERMACLPEPLTLYRRHNRNVSVLFSPAAVIQKYSCLDGEIHARKLADFSGRMRTLQHLLQSRLQDDYEKMSENKKYLAELIRFFEKRKNLLYYFPLFRLFHLSIRDFRCYFTCCRGFRTLAHDLICRKVPRGVES